MSQLFRALSKRLGHLTYLIHPKNSTLGKISVSSRDKTARLTYDADMRSVRVGWMLVFALRLGAQTFGGAGKLELDHVDIALRLPGSPGIAGSHTVAQAGNSFTITVNAMNTSPAGSGTGKFTLNLPKPEFTSYRFDGVTLQTVPIPALEIGLSHTGTTDGGFLAILAGPFDGTCRGLALSVSNQSRTFNCNFGTLDVVKIDGRNFAVIPFSINYGGFRNATAYYRFDTPPQPPEPPKVQITETFPLRDQPIWGLPVRMPTFTAVMQYTAPTSGEIGIELQDDAGNLINAGDRTAKIQAGSGSVTLSMSPVGYDTGVKGLFLQASMLTMGPDGKLSVSTKTERVRFVLSGPPKISGEPGCLDEVEKKFRSFGQDDFGAVTFHCQPMLEVKAEFAGLFARLSADVTKLWDDEVVSTRVLPPQLISPLSFTLPALDLEPENGKPGNHFDVRLLLRHEGTRQIAVADPLTIPIVGVRIAKCVPSTVLSLQESSAACLVQYTNWGTSRIFGRTIQRDPEQKIETIDANKGGTAEELIQFSKTTPVNVDYRLTTPSLSETGIATAALDGKTFYRLVSTLDDVVTVVGRDKVTDFVTGSLTFVNGLGLPGKIGTVSRIAADACAGSGGAKALTDLMMALKNKERDCLSKLQEAYAQFVPKAAVAAADPVGPVGFLPLGYTWVFDTVQPAGKGFAADLMLRYTAEMFPDHPDFDESKLRIISWDPTTSTFEILQTSLDLANRTATARIDRLAPNYGLAMIEPLSSTLLRTPVLPGGGGSGRSSRLVLNNPDATPAKTVLATFDSVGTGTSRSTLQQAAESQTVGPVIDLLESKPLRLTGWLEITSDHRNSNGTLIIEGAGLIDALPLEAEGGRSWVLSSVEHSASYRTEIHLSNSSKSPATVECELRGADGAVVGSWSGSIDAKGKLALGLTGMFSGIAAPFTGYLVVASSQNIHAAALIAGDDALNAVAGKPAPTGSTNGRLYAPLVGGPEMPSARLTLTNFDSKPVAAVIRGFKADGSVLPTSNVSIEPFQQYSKGFDQLFGASAVPVFVRVESLQDTLLGDITLSDVTGDRARTSVPLRSMTAAGTTVGTTQGVTIPYVTSENGTITTVNVSNLGTASAVFSLTMVTPSGVRKATVNLAQNASTSQTLAALFGSAAGTGYLTIASTQPAAAVALVDPKTGDMAAVGTVVEDASSTTPLPGSGGSPAISVSSASLDFGSVVLGGTPSTTTRTLTITNTGTAPLNVTAISTTSPFSVSPVSIPSPLPPGASTSATVTFAPTTAGAISRTLTIASNDTAKPTVTIALVGMATAAPSAGQISVTPTALDFLEVNSGTTKDLPLTIRNAGGQSLVISAVNISNNRFQIPFGSLPITVIPAGTATIVVRFLPSAAGRQTGTLTIESNDSVSPSLSVPLSGTGVGTAAVPRVVVTVTSIDFGPVRVNSQDDRTFEIRNTGTAPLIVQSMALDNNAYTVGPPAPFTLAPNAIADVGVTFKPKLTGSQPATLRIVTNDPVNGTITIPIAGVGQ